MPVNPTELFQTGKVREAITALTAYVRDHPSDVKQRIFLFELLCFSGEFQRAERQLAVLGSGNTEKETGAILYYAALHAEKTRHDLFEQKKFPDPCSDSPPGKLNEKPFDDLRDADPKIGARLEVFAAGAYVWLPFEHISKMEMAPPRRLRDTLWAPAAVQTAPSFRDMDLGEVLIPTIYPFSWKREDANVWLGRMTDWSADEQGRESPTGQKMLLVDGEEFPILEVRSLEFFPTANTSAGQ